MNETADWRAAVKDAYGSPGTDVIFARAQERAKVGAIYRSGKLEIKR